MQKKKKENVIVDKEQLENPNSMINSMNPYISSSALETLGVKKSSDNSGEEVIGENEIRVALETFRKYHNGKSALDRRIIANERWYKLRHWEQIRDKKSNDVEPVSAWLFNCLANKHADAMDSYPCPNILPRQQDDVEMAKALSSIVPIVLEQNGFEEAYDRNWWYKLKQGCAFYGVFWNPDKLNGIGDIDIKKVDMLNLAWQPGVTDIQDSPNLFHAVLVDNDVLERQFEQLRGKLGNSSGILLTEYVHDENITTEDKSLVIDWYYKKDGLLHYCKFCNETVLFATENDDDFKDTGWYEHGMYPFVPDVLFPEEDTPVGFGYIDICKDPQAYIDVLSQAVLKNALVCSTPRYFARGDESGINEEEFLDLTKPIVHIDGPVGTDQLQPIATNGISGNYLNYLEMKIDEMKETSGNRDVAQGGTTGGVTAASAISAMQEAASKMSRDMNKASYRAYKKICYLVVELIRQFYALPRTFRLTGENEEFSFAVFDNTQLKTMSMGEAYGVDGGERTPYFDIEITAEKESPYSKMSNNELALQLYSAEFFNPQNADAALACASILDFKQKDEVIEKIKENGTMLQTIQQLQAQVAQLSSMLGVQSGVMPSSDGQPIKPKGKVDMKEETTEPKVTRQARERVAQSTAPRE